MERLNQFNQFNRFLADIAGAFHSVALLGLRLYASWMFFPAGLLKAQNWDSTLLLFEYEYNVPLISPTLAAWLGTGGELVLPVLLSLGLLTRFSAAGLFIVNAVAVISLADMAPAALRLHELWGLALATIALWGGGLFSADRLIAKVAAGSRPINAGVVPG